MDHERTYFEEEKKNPMIGLSRSDLLSSAEADVA